MAGLVDDSHPNDDSIRVLVVEGNSKQAAAVRKSLQAASPNFVVSPARQLWSASQILAGMSIDAVLLGLALPDSEGLEALIELRDQSPDTPVLILGQDSHSGADALEAGADDYLDASHLDPGQLGRRLLEAIERRQRAAESADTPAEPSQDSQSTAELIRVLVVEDDVWIRRLLCRNLERHGHHVEAVDSPQQALAWSQEADAELDVLVCDVHPPGMDGHRLGQHLQKTFPGLVTVLVGPGDTPPGGAREALADLVFLSKPYALDDFEAAIEQIVAQRSDAQSS